MPQSVDILFEDNHLLVVDKPAGMATMGAAEGQATVARWAANYLKRKYHKPGNVFVGVVSRLDRLVSGALVLARTSKAASRLSEQIRQRSTEKRYLAIVACSARQAASLPSHLEDWTDLHDQLRKNDRLHRMECCLNGQSGQDAHLRFRECARSATSSRIWRLLEVELITGRKHQIRVQLSAAGWPIVGDSKYGSSLGQPDAIALHCHRLTLQHPTKKERMQFQTSPTARWREMGQAFPGELFKALTRFDNQPKPR